MSVAETPLPYLTHHIPGIGGRLRAAPEDFQVEEIAAYEPCGEGEHVYVWVEKRGMTTSFLVRELARLLQIRESDIGTAGLKDRHAVTRQWISLPSPVTPEAVNALELPHCRILRTARHGNKLRTGHLRGNRFILRVRDLNCEANEALARTAAVFEHLGKSPGAPNWFASQRFGRDGKNAEIGEQIIKKQDGSGRMPRGRQRRLYVSSYQSKLFNEYLARRMRDGLFATVLVGDVLQKRQTGGVFLCEEPPTDQLRHDTGELCITGPMFGHKMKTPPKESDAYEREWALLHEEGIELGSFAHLGKLALGTRRSLSILLGETKVALVDEAVHVEFALPAGSYATAVMREVMKGPTLFPS